jgi:hypothetical protein
MFLGSWVQLGNFLARGKKLVGYFEVVAWLAWSEGPESYADGRVATGRGSHAGQVKGDDPDKKRYPGPPGWWLGVGLTIPPCKTWICLETSTEAS